MIQLRWQALVALSVMSFIPEMTYAQPSRQLPGARPFLVGMMQSPPNSRVRPAASQVGLESTDFYGKRGYPKQLGDVVEALNTGGAAAGMGGGVAGNTGNTGVQSAGSSGFQGNTGNQIGQQGGGTILGGVFGFSNNNGGNGFGGNRSPSGGMTGGGFSGMVPKGFGFGGTPDLSKTWNSPLHGSNVR